jgi:hypothetical protein
MAKGNGDDLIAQSKSSKYYAPQRASAAKLIDPGFLTEPAAASKRERPKGVEGAAIQAGKGGRPFAAGTQGAEPQRFAKGGEVHSDEAQDKALFSKMLAKEEKGEPEGKACGGRMAKGGRPKMNLHLKEGALHKQMGVPEGKKIPAGRLESASNSSNPLTRKRAQFAINAKKWKHKDGGSIKAHAKSPAEATDGSAAETGVMKGPSNPMQKYAKGGKAEPKAEAKPRNKVARNPVPPALNAPPMAPAMPPAAPPMGAPPMGGAPGFAVGGVAKIRHGEMTKGQKQTPNKPSGWNAYK